MDMKRLKFILGLVAGTAVLSMMGCDLAVRNRYIADTASTTKAANVPADNINQFTLGYDAAISTVDGEAAVDLASVAGSGKAVTDAPLHWENPIYDEESEAKGFTVTMDIYPSLTGTYSGVLGFYDNSNHGFLWITNTYLMWNTTANSDTDADCTFSYADPAGANYPIDLNLADAKWQSLALVFSDESVKIYVDGALVTKVNESANGTSIGAVVEFATKYADYIAVGAGCEFWDNGGFSGTGIKNIKVYDAALTTNQLGTVLGTTISENVSFKDFEEAVKALQEKNADLTKFTDALIKVVAEEVDDGIKLLLEAGVSVDKLIKLGISVKDMLDAGVEVKDLIAVGTSIYTLYANNVTLQQLKEAGVDITNSTWTGTLGPSTGWWKCFTPNDIKVNQGILVVKFKLKQVGNKAWQKAPCVQLRASDETEFVLARPDNYGWGAGWDAAGKSDNFNLNWETFGNSLTADKEVAILIFNTGDDKASIRYEWDSYYIAYDNIPVNKDDLNVILALDADLTIEFITE